MVGLVGVATLAGASHEASACGGTFCDTGPLAMPVDQTGREHSLRHEFGSVEAHIQIQYQGDAAKFAWVIPLQSLPEFEVGSQALFTNLLQGTVPTYGYQQSFDSCGDSGGFGGSSG